MLKQKVYLIALLAFVASPIGVYAQTLHMDFGMALGGGANYGYAKQRSADDLFSYTPASGAGPIQTISTTGPSKAASKPSESSSSSSSEASSPTLIKTAPLTTPNVFNGAIGFDMWVGKVQPYLEYNARKIGLRPSYDVYEYDSGYGSNVWDRFLSFGEREFPLQQFDRNTATFGLGFKPVETLYVRPYGGAQWLRFRSESSLITTRLASLSSITMFGNRGNDESRSARGYGNIGGILIEKDLGDEMFLYVDASFGDASGRSFANETDYTLDILRSGNQMLFVIDFKAGASESQFSATTRRVEAGIKLGLGEGTKLKLGVGEELLRFNFPGHLNTFNYRYGTREEILSFNSPDMISDHFTYTKRSTTRVPLFIFSFDIAINM